MSKKDNIKELKAIKEWRSFCKYTHDVTCNQNYKGELPYSFHLEAVYQTCLEWSRLLPTDESVLVAFFTALGHDLIEDARVSYNDILKKVEELLRQDEEFFKVFVSTSAPIVAGKVAESIYNVTDEKGRNRKERKNDKYVRELKANKTAVFVKLCDIASNALFSSLSQSRMLKTYRAEFPKLKKELYTEEYEELFNYIENNIINK